MIARSLLFVPALDELRIPKAFASAADEVILDLEDAVAESRKSAARACLGGVFLSHAAHNPWVRINGFNTSHGYEDVLAAARAGARRLVLPKAESAEEVRCIAWVLLQLERELGLPPGTIELLCIIESARGLQAADAIACASPRVVRLMFGAVDLATDMEADFSDEYGALSQARFQVARASRVAGLAPPVDTAYIDTANEEGLRLTSVNARALGFAGKVCIHPKQIARVNEVFSPTDAQVAFARKVVAAFSEAESSGKAAVLVDGVMVDYPVVARAQQVLNKAGKR